MTGWRSTTTSGRTAASAACRPAPICRGPSQRESLLTVCVLDGEAYGSTKSLHPHIDFVLALSEEEREDLKEMVEGELGRSSPEDEASKNNRQFLERTLLYLRMGKSTIEIVLGPDNIRKVRIPHVVTYTVPSFDATKPQKHALVEWFLESMPAVRLFAPTDELADSITLQELNVRANLPFEGLLKLASGWEDRNVLFEDNTRARQRLDQLGRALTRKIKRIWSQGAGHTYRFDQTGGRLHVSIKDPVAFDVPSRRSRGFRSFLSFYLTLLAETDEVNPEGYLLLFDEPGIHLHPQGQKDLLAELRRLARRNQIVYATHSPFMIDRNEPTSTVLVYKGTRAKEKGTRVNYKPWGANWNPLSGALGVTPADAFFLPECPVVVEGTSDKLYVATYMGLSRAYTGADLNYLTLIDGDRRRDVEAIVRILVGTGRPVVVIRDHDDGGREWERTLRKLAGNSKAVNVVNLGGIVGRDKPVSIEDLLPELEWRGAMQKYVKDLVKSDHVIDWDDVSRRAKDRTMGRAAAEYLVDVGVLDNVKRFSKTNVAHLLCQRELPMPEEGSPIVRLCREVTRRINF